MSSNSAQRKREPWRNNERHYCAVCNSWMGSDKQSILIHEQGKKHKENVEKSMKDRRASKQRQEQQDATLQKTLQQMEAAARTSFSNDLGRFTGSLPPLPTATSSVSSEAYAQVPVGRDAASSSNKKNQAKQDKKEWEERKKQRQEEKTRPRNETDDESQQPSSKRQRIQIRPDQGHYTLDNDRVFLEGVVFGDMLEEDMPIQLWTGNIEASDSEKRLPDRDVYWKNAIVAGVRHRPSAETDEDRLLVDIAYLKSETDDQETLEKSVPLNRIRIQLGADKTIPDTLEEARIMAMGGEEIVVDQSEKQGEVDENTGFSSWSTVAIVRTTVRQELKQDRDRLRQQRKEAALEAERQKKEAEFRRMEEAKVANADDSALGAYDVWNRTKEGYKGVDINADVKVDVHDLGKKLADGSKPVAFKKNKFNAKKKKSNGRRTSADDD